MRVRFLRLPLSAVVAIFVSGCHGDGMASDTQPQATDRLTATRMSKLEGLVLRLKSPVPFGKADVRSRHPEDYLVLVTLHISGSIPGFPAQINCITTTSTTEPNLSDLDIAQAEERSLALLGSHHASLVEIVRP